MGTRPSSASASTAAASPSSASTAGKIPWASSRSSTIASRNSDFGSVEASNRVRSRTRRQLQAREAQRQRESHEPLLRAVVKITLEPLSLRIACLDDARAGCAQLYEPSLYLSLEALVLEREPGGRRDVFHELLVVEESGRVGEHRHSLPVLYEPRLFLANVQLDRASLRIDESVSRAQRIGEDEVWIADRPGEDVSEAAWWRRLWRGRR